MKSFFFNSKELEKILACLFFAIITAPLFAKPQSSVKYVSVANVQVKEKASAKAKTVSTVPYALKVIVLSEKGSWAEIQAEEFPEIKGWVNSSVLSARKLVASQETVSTDAHEIALAGKGFNSTVEESYSQSHESHFDDVDLIETNMIDDETLFQFLSEGHLSEGEE